MPSPNTVLQNRYRIIRQLGQGGMGKVYEAVDQRLSSVVAIKEMQVTTEEVRRAFEREASLLANLRHQSLPRVIDHFSEGDGQYLVMEFIPGEDLGQLLELRDRPFPVAKVLRWGDELLKALEYLHGHNPPILHRDIKPSNVKLTREGELFLLDFGLAKGAAGQMPTLLTSRSVKGYTPAYSSLEQIHGAGTDPRSDLYSLGATLYHLLTGMVPADAPTRFVAMDDEQPDPLPRADETNAALPRTVAAVLESAMSMNRRQRPASAKEMRRLLLEAAELSAGDANGGLPTAAMEGVVSGDAPPFKKKVLATFLLPTEPGEPIESDSAPVSPLPTIPAPVPILTDQSSKASKALTSLQPSPRRRLRLLVAGLLVLLFVLIVGSTVVAPKLISWLKRRNVNASTANPNAPVVLNGQTQVPGPNPSPTPLSTPMPTSVTVRMRIVNEWIRQDVETLSPERDGTVILRANDKTYTARTDRQGYVTFAGIPCDAQLQVTFPRYDIYDPTAPEDAKLTWTITRNVACDNPVASLGTYFTGSGTTKGKYY